jgi:hypothetical protein
MTYFKSQPDGSGVVSLALDNYVAGRCWQDWAECFTWDHVIADPTDLGIKVQRCIAVDYSGKCGAPALLIVVDRITGAGEREAWVQTNLGREGVVTIEGAGFTSRLPQTSEDAAAPRQMCATFAVPTGVQLKLLPADAKAVGGGVLQARGGEEYFMVATIGTGEAPAVKVQGAGLNAKVTIGQRKVWFDGGKVVLGE